MTYRILAGVAVALAIATSACTPSATPTPPWHQESGYRWRELTVPRRGSPGFASVSGRRSGIQFTNDVSDSVLLGNRILGQGAGVALGDVDGDGMVDVFLARTQGCSALYRNLGGWRFEETTQSAGVGACDRHASGATFADTDGDGDLDLILLATTGPNAIFVNDGHGRFTERRDLGLESAGEGGTTATLADVDGDGTLELYVANYKAYNLDDTLPPQRRDFNRMIRQTAPGRYEIVPEFRREYKLVMRPDMGGLRMSMRGAADAFYRNEARRFVRVPIPDRFRDTVGRAISEAPESFGLAARFIDIDGDGAPELYVANDFEDTDELWLNDGRGNYRLADWRSQRQMSHSAMGIDFADIDGDGRPDLFEVDMLANDRRLKTQIPTHTALPKRPGDIESQLQLQRNSLFLNRGDRTFAEISSLAGVEASGWSWSTMFLDVDLDGWQDILVANGHLWDIMDGDVQERLQNRTSDAGWQRIRWEFPKLALKNVAFRNRGDLTFEDAGKRWNFGTEEDISSAMASADLDGDGDLDVIVNRLRSPALVLRNESRAPRIGVRLIGDAPNTRAVGAKIRLLNGAVSQQVREVAAGGLYLSHSDYEASFAMGRSERATLEVDWRDGRRTVISDVRPNRLYEITTATAAMAPRAPGDSMHTLFADVTPQLGGHVHVDPPFDDWARQSLLPNAMSQLGPGVAWYDIDSDGDEDLLVGAGRGGKLGVFRNERGRLVPQLGQGIVAPTDLTTVLGTAPSAPGETAQLIVGVSGWESRAFAGTASVAVKEGIVASRAEPLTPPRVSAAGPVALGDYDGDGDLDLFVGGRAIPGRYPVPASSALYRNDGGRFVPDSANTSVLSDVGLVSAAMFADVDGDGRPDLVLAREWDSVLLLLNRNGRFTVAPPSWGLERWTSRWNGVAAGDLDGDGRLDLVATSWGRNTGMPADSTRPLLLYYGPFGSSGETEPLLASEDPGLGAPSPLNGYARMRAAISDLPIRVSTFAAFADASVDRVLGPQRSLAQEKRAVTLDHMIFLNRGDHFDARPLPVEAQFAPGFYAGIADFDGDGKEDVFLSQNFFPTAVGLPRYDEGRGLLLLGDGKGALTSQSGQRSGIEVYGDQRGAAYADFNADGRLDLVVSQNGAATRLFQNRGAKPGLRVRVSGPPTNPFGVGAQLRLVYDGDRMGPVREIQAGSGYWSQNGAVQVLGLDGNPTAVWIRWPGGSVGRVPVPPGSREVIVRQ